MPNTLEELIDEIEIINEQFDGQLQEENFLEELNENGRKTFNSMHIAFKDMETRFTNALDYLVPESKINNTNIGNGLIWVKSGLKTPDSYNNYNITGNFSKGFAFLANLASTMPLPLAESSDRLKDAARSLSASIGQYQGRHERSLEELETKKEQLDRETHDLEDKKFNIEEQWNELENIIKEKEKSLEDQYSKLHSDFINNQTDRATTFDNFMHNLKENQTDLINHEKENFEMEKTNFIEKIEIEKDNLIEEWERNFQSSISNITTESEDSRKDFNDKSTELIEDLRKKQEEAASIVGKEVPI